MNLAPYRHQLVRETLRCENEYIETLAELLHEGAVIPDSVKSVIQLLSRGNGDPSRMTRGKVGKCARDMVGECRRCAKVVCRVSRLPDRSAPLLTHPIFRTAPSNLPISTPLKVASVAFVDPVALYHSPPTSPETPTHTLAPGTKTALLLWPLHVRHAIAKKLFGCARNAGRPCAAMTQPTVVSGLGGQGIAHI